MNAATRERIEEIVRDAPETLPASIVELDDSTREALLIRTEWNHDRISAEQLTPARLATEAARYLAESRVVDEQATRDDQAAARAVEAILGR